MDIYNVIQIRFVVHCDKIAAILQNIFLKAFSHMTIIIIFFQLSLKFVPNVPISNKQALVQMMA